LEELEQDEELQNYDEESVQKITSDIPKESLAKRFLEPVLNVPVNFMESTFQKFEPALRPLMIEKTNMTWHEWAFIVIILQVLILAVKGIHIVA
jgi:hypothetical protein